MKRQIKNIKEDIEGGTYYSGVVNDQVRENMDDNHFFKVVQGIVKFIDYDKLKDHAQPDELVERVTLISDITKLYGMNNQNEDTDGFIHAIFY